MTLQPPADTLDSSRLPEQAQPSIAPAQKGAKTVRVLAWDEVALLLKDVTQALGFERRYQFIDVEGKRSTFSAFVRTSLKKLALWVSTLRPDLAPGTEQLQGVFQRYPALALGARMQAVESLEHWVRQVSQQPVTPQQMLSDHPADLSANSDPFIALLNTSVMSLSGVGPKLQTALNAAGIRTLEHLLCVYPRKHLDYQQRVPLNALVDGQDMTVAGRVYRCSVFDAKQKPLTIVTVILSDGLGKVQLSWFLPKAQKALAHQMKSRYADGTLLMASGRARWDNTKHLWRLESPNVDVIEDATAPGESLQVGRLVPQYTVPTGLTVGHFRKLMHQAVGLFAERLQAIGGDPLLPFLQQLPSTDDCPTLTPPVSLAEALRGIHFPESHEQLAQAHVRLVFDEFFFIQMRLLQMRQQYKEQAQGTVLTQKPGGYWQQLLDQLPFQLTQGQRHAFDDIASDLAKPQPMYRLLQGDVGCGKTIVALLTVLMAVDHGYQGAMMAPTEILAEQHYYNAVRWLTPLGLKAGLLLGKNNAKQRREVLQGLANGQIHLAIGTHALIQDAVQFANLGVVVVDEQHRFGVRQRSLLKDKGDNPDLLTMTATPIPRSLALTLHGDLDLSVIRERPPGRTPIVTRLLPERQRQDIWAAIRETVVRGEQVYVVLPLIEESESLSAQAATTVAEQLQTQVFPQWTIGLLHGKLSPAEKEQVMQGFAQGKTPILVSTTVVEVGVDVPNATLMVIENAERFGLAQLHQLRGRVGRGQKASTCLLVSSATSGETYQRLQLLTESDDGFVIAEQDMALRGPGEFLGTRQSGLPDFALSDLTTDQPIVEAARAMALQVLETSEGLVTSLQAARLSAWVAHKHQQAFAGLASG